MMAPAPTQTPSSAAMIGCGQARIALTRSPVMRVKCEQVRHVHVGQRADDLVHVAARAEVAAVAPKTTDLDGRRRRAGRGTSRAARHSSRRSAGSCARAGSRRERGDAGRRPARRKCCGRALMRSELLVGDGVARTAWSCSMQAVSSSARSRSTIAEQLVDPGLVARGHGRRRPRSPAGVRRDEHGAAVARDGQALDEAVGLEAVDEPVMLPFETISDRGELAHRQAASGARSSAAITSKRGRVVSKRRAGARGSSASTVRETEQDAEPEAQARLRGGVGMGRCGHRPQPGRRASGACAPAPPAEYFGQRWRAARVIPRLRRSRSPGR